MMMLCRDFFGISSDFPVNQLMVRDNDETNLFYVTPALKHLVDCNQAVVNVSSLFSVLVYR